MSLTTPIDRIRAPDPACPPEGLRDYQLFHAAGGEKLYSGNERDEVYGKVSSFAVN